MLRDKYSIIVQGSTDDPNYQDGGDSCFSTGLSAFGGSELDLNLMPLFIKGGLLVRHPYQSANTGTAPHNDPKSLSRDQALAFFSGLIGQKKNDQNSVVFESCINYAKSWRINSDILSPSNKIYLYICAGEIVPLWLRIMAKPIQTSDLLFNCFGNPDHEMNQALVANYAYGEKWIKFLYKNHPDLFENIREYFDGWRDRAPIADGMIGRVWLTVR